MFIVHYFELAIRACMYYISVASYGKTNEYYIGVSFLWNCKKRKTRKKKIETRAELKRTQTSIGVVRVSDAYRETFVALKEHFKAVDCLSNLNR